MNTPAPQPAHEVTVTPSDNGQVAVVRFTTDHPANIFTPGLLDDLLAAVDQLPAMDDLRVVVLTGSDRAFAGGADLQSMQSLSDDEYRNYIETEYRLFRAIERLPMITLAAIAGPCVGNGAELALACDLRIAGAGARIGFPEPKVGFVAPAQRLSRYLGIGRAKELLYTGRLLKADAALSMGLVTDVAADDDLAKCAEELAAEYAARAPLALRRTKEGLERFFGASGDHDADEQAAAFETFKSADFTEGSTATLERRQPTFSGR